MKHSWSPRFCISLCATYVQINKFIIASDIKERLKTAYFKTLFLMVVFAVGTSPVEKVKRLFVLHFPELVLQTVSLLMAANMFCSVFGDFSWQNGTHHANSRGNKNELQLFKGARWDYRCRRASQTSEVHLQLLEFICKTRLTCRSCSLQTRCSGMLFPFSCAQTLAVFWVRSLFFFFI